MLYQHGQFALSEIMLSVKWLSGQDRSDASVIRYFSESCRYFVWLEVVLRGLESTIGGGSITLELDLSVQKETDVPSVLLYYILNKNYLTAVFGSESHC